MNYCYFESSRSNYNACSLWMYSALECRLYRVERQDPRLWYMSIMLCNCLISNISSSSTPLSNILIFDPHNITHYKLATFSRRQKPMCLQGDIVQYRLLWDKGCNFIMSLSIGEPRPIFSNVAFGPQATLENIGFGSPLDNATIFCELIRYYTISHNILKA